MINPRSYLTALLALLLVAIVASAAPACAQSLFVVVEPDNPPAPIMPDEDVAKIA